MNEAPAHDGISSIAFLPSSNYICAELNGGLDRWCDAIIQQAIIPGIQSYKSFCSMSRPRILITGASGFLGGHLCRIAGQEGEVIGAYHAHQTLSPGTIPLQLDLENAQALAAQLAEVKPDIVIHTAVLQVDACEQNPELAKRVNVQAAHVIAEWCGCEQRRLVYISSDLVFEGTKGEYAETDPSNPVMLYGKTKLAAERAVLEYCPSACVARLPLMYGFPAAGGSNFFLNMLTRLQHGERVPVFQDQYRTPGLVNNMAAAVWELAASNFRGVLHVAGATRCSRYDVARLVCRLGNLDEALLQPVSMFDIPALAPRPKDVSLICAMAKSVLQTKLIGVEEGLQLIL